MNRHEIDIHKLYIHKNNKNIILVALYMCTCILKEHTILLYFESEYVEIHIIKSSAIEILPLVLISNRVNNGMISSNIPPKLPSWFSGKEFSCQCRRYRFYPWVIMKIPWKRKWQTTPVFLPGESHGCGLPSMELQKCQTWLSMHACTMCYLYSHFPDCP